MTTSGWRSRSAWPLGAPRRASAALVLGVLTLMVSHAWAQPSSEDAVERGEYLFKAAACASCHTPDDDGAPPLAGGRPFDTPFGTLYSSNITQDPDTGLGRWTEADLRRALRLGLSPRGRHYFPAFPYTSYRFLTDADIADLWAYLQTLDPVAKRTPEPQLRLPFSWRPLLWVWKGLYLDGARAAPPPTQTRGAYLAQAVMHCGECHTPRDRLGGLKYDLYLAGSDHGVEFEPAPNITGHREDGIGAWRLDDLVFFFEIGMLPNGDFVGGSMTEVIDQGTSQLTDADRRALAEHLQGVEPVPAPDDPQ